MKYRCYHPDYPKWTDDTDIEIAVLTGICLLGIAIIGAFAIALLVMGG
jgi:hypothetical protein